MKEDTEIDKLFKSRADAFRPTVPAGAWNRLEANIHRRRRKRVFLWAASIALLISAGGGVVLSTLRHDLQPAGQLQTAVSNNQRVEPSPKKHTADPYSKPEAGATEQNPAYESKKDLSVNNKKPAPYTANAKAEIPAELHTAEEQLAITPYSISAQEINKVAKVSPASTEELPTLEKAPAETLAVYSPMPPNPPFAQLSPLNEPKPSTSHARAFFSLSSGPEYSSYFGNTSRYAPSTQTTSGLEQGLTTPSYRLEGGYFISASFALSSGVQRGSFGHVADFLSPAEISFVRVNEFGRTDAGSFKAVYIEEMMQKSGIETVDELNKFDKLRISFEYFDVPISLTFTTPLYKQLKFGLSGGINTALIEQNRVSLRKQHEWYEVGIIENTRKQLFGINSGLTLEYYPEFLHGLGLFTRSGYRYYFTSISENTTLIYRPYSIDILAGLKYNLK